MVNTLTQAEWIARCAGQLLRIDPKLSSDEATGLAHEFFAFQRTAAMTPEAAADFVAAPPRALELYAASVGLAFDAAAVIVIPADAA